MKEDLRKSFGGDSRREARCLGKTTGKTMRKLLLLPSSSDIEVIKGVCRNKEE